MSEPHVTITLGRTGQKVVKRSQTVSGGSQTDYGQLAGSKRSTSQRFGNNADGSLLPTNKRLRGDFGANSRGHSRVNDVRVGRNDLRLKLMRKELSRQIQNEVEERKKMDHLEKMSRPIWSKETRLLRHASPTDGAAEMLQAESIRKSYPHAGDALNPRSLGRFLKVSQEISTLMRVDEQKLLPSRRPGDTSRTGLILNSVLYPYRTTIDLAPVTMRATYDAGKLVSGPPRGSGLPNTSYTGEQPLTVSALLHSLGLGKYAICFQAEEVDMAALKQMGDKDLKELGIPMGPRKKILLALLSQSKRQPL